MSYQQETLSKPRSGTSRRGFASMDRAKQRQIAALGGRASHASGNAHEFTSEEARRAGSKGGKAAHASGNAHQFSPEEAARAGRKGGQAAHANGNAHEFSPEEARLAGAKGGRVTNQNGSMPFSSAPSQIVEGIRKSDY